MEDGVTELEKKGDLLKSNSVNGASPSYLLPIRSRYFLICIEKIY